MKKENTRNFTEYSWQVSYRTSCLKSDGQPIDILHEFYMPILYRSIQYRRVGGYFTPTSLAAASQGLSALIQNKGKVFFVVGLDIDDEEAQKILNQHIDNKNYDRLAEVLNLELEGFDTWDDSVQNGMHLIGWMVSKGFLEIRVGIRVNGKTGKPILFESFEDGYVHNRYGIFQDAFENRAYINGCLNESYDNLVINAESIDMHCEWKNEDNAKRIEDASYEFEMLWEDLNPYMRVFHLPESVENRLISLVEFRDRLKEIDGTISIAVKAPIPSAIEILRFAIIKDSPKLPGGRYVGMETAPISLWPHQEIAARRLIEGYPNSYMMCDEVGLGKTVEAGLVIRSLYLSGLIDRVLVVAPESQAAQWHREMSMKFFLPFALAKSGHQIHHHYLMPLEEDVKSVSLYSPDLNIISTSLFTQPERQRDIELSPSFDLAILDEAHYAVRIDSSNGDEETTPRHNDLYKNVSRYLRKKSKSLYLATAFPVQMGLTELHDLLKLTNRIGPFHYDVNLFKWYFDILRRLLHDETITPFEWTFLRKVILNIENEDPQCFDFISRSFIYTKEGLGIKRWLDQKEDIDPSQINNILNPLIFSTSPLYRGMIRHTRSLLKILRQNGKLNLKLADRVVLPIAAIQFTDSEKQYYEEILSYGKLLREKLLQGDNLLHEEIQIYITFLIKRFSSSLTAIRETLRRRQEKVIDALMGMYKEDEEEISSYNQGLSMLLKDRNRNDLIWEGDFLSLILEKLPPISGPSSKMIELLKVLETDRRIFSTGRIRQTVIFTSYYETLTEIISNLREADETMRIGSCSDKGCQYTDVETSSLINTTIEDIKYRFLREEIDVLVCVDNASEGLNLQNADMLINFDMPWNSRRLEQRIARIDRIGQKYDTIEIMHLCHQGSAEEIVYGRIKKRLEDIEETYWLNLLPVTRREFREMADGVLGEEELELRIRNRITRNSLTLKNREIPASEMYTMYLRLIRDMETPKLPVSLDSIWETLYGSKYFQELGCSVLPDTNQKALSLKNIQGIPDGTFITASRELYEYGLKEHRNKINFATFGNPVFEILLNHMDAYGLPPCVKRVEIDKPDIFMPMVGYVVACLNTKGQSEKRLITSLVQLDGIIPDESASLTWEDVLPFYKELEKLCEKECQNISTVNRAEMASLEAGNSQLAMNYLIAISWLQSIGVEEADFWEAIKKTKTLCKDKSTMTVSDLPVEIVKDLQGLLFDFEILADGKKANMSAPTDIMLGALTIACQKARQMNESNPSTAKVLSELKVELQKIGVKNGKASGYR